MFLLILIVAAFESIIRYHQHQYYNHPHHPKPERGVLFPTITRHDADKSIMSCFKFFVNYFFYKFGLEVKWVGIWIPKTFFKLYSASFILLFRNLSLDIWSVSFVLFCRNCFCPFLVFLVNVFKTYIIILFYNQLKKIY